MKADYTELSPQDVARELLILEKKFGMPSDEFAQKYLAGELPEHEDHVIWIGLWRMRAAAKNRNAA